MKKLLKKDETLLKGQWEIHSGRMMQDRISDRIQWLTESVLREVSVDGDKWTALYQDPQDGRYWELSYPLGHMQGGGPPVLQVISESEARKKYDGLARSERCRNEKN